MNRNVLVLVGEASVVSSYEKIRLYIQGTLSFEFLRTGNELERLRNVSTELVGVGSLDFRHIGGT